MRIAEFIIPIERFRQVQAGCVDRKPMRIQLTDTFGTRKGSLLSADVSTYTLQLRLISSNQYVPELDVCGTIASRTAPAGAT